MRFSVVLRTCFSMKSRIGYAKNPASIIIPPFACKVGGIKSHATCPMKNATIKFTMKKNQEKGAEPSFVF